MNATTEQLLQPWHGLWGLVLSVGAVVGAAFLVATWLTRLQARLRGHHGPLRPLVAWLPVAQILAWVIAGLVSLALLATAPPAWLLVVIAPALIVTAFASRDIVRNAFAGAALAFEHSILAGDLIEVATDAGDVRGQVVAIGVRRTLLRYPDGADVLLPNLTLFNSTVRTNRGHELDSVVEIELDVDEQVSTAEFPRLQEIARRAAATSRFASPHKKPEVFLEPSAEGAYRVTVQAYAFAPDYVRHLRTDVISLFNEGRLKR